tara:strand:- start:710 stop:1102 length:393 start_codon:yes stop_codon:yes gene_type:complete
MLTKLYTIVILLLSVSGSIYYGYNHYINLKNQLEIKTSEASKYKSSLKDVETTVNVLSEQNSKIQKETLQLQKSLQKAENYNIDLQKKLNDHNLTKLSSKKPGLIEKRINEATSKIFAELEEITSTDTTN